ncbi:hypothetical protein F4778DRAFT_787735 [Xylariomycetidae sp. FL2044]|nr:hypothetical protein F4778DRAFT_787735 [Xylariomycetidae sp. FL2044]
MKRSREPEEEFIASSPDAEDGQEHASTRPPAAKIIEVDESALDATSSVEMKCSLPPHREVLSFKTYEEYESHYSKAHMNRCIECRKNFPSEHLLNVHHEDCHDSFAAVKREKGEHTYSCYVEGCDRKCRTPYKRRCHLIDKHMYPKNYFFAVTRDGIDGRSSLLMDGGHHRRRSSTATTAGGSKTATRRLSLRQESAKSDEEASKKSVTDTKPSPEEITKDTSQRKEVPDVEMEDLSGAMSSLRFVPSSIRFGRGGGKAGFAKR